jgi:PAS domain S-box-containing protein
MFEHAPVCGNLTALTAILETLYEGVLVVGPDNQVTCSNGHLQRILGIDRDVLSGADAAWLIHKTITEDSGRAEILAFLAGRSKSADVFCRPRSPGDEKKWVHCSCRVVDKGPLPGMRIIRLSPEPAVLAGDSISEASAGIEGLLQESGYRFLVENLNEGIGLIDKEGVAVFANKRIADITGYPVDELIGMPVGALVDEEGAACLGAYLQGLDQNSHEVFEIDLIHRDGTRIHTLMATTPIIDTDGACRGFLAGVQDITPLKRMEMQLRESEEKYRSLVELSAEATLIHRDGKIVYINPAGMRLLGASSPEEVLGTAILDIIHPEARGTIEAFTSRDLQGEETPLAELRVVRLDGTTIPVEGRGTRMFYSGRPAVQVVMRDVTDRKQAQEQLQASNRRLTLLNRIAGTSASARSPGELMETALNQMLDLLGYDGGVVYHTGAGERMTAPRYERNMPDGCLERAESLMGEFCARALAVGQPLYVERDPDPNSPASRLLRELRFAALACIPLVVESDVFGTLLVGSRHRGSFSPEERRLLEAVGREIGAGILRGLLYQRLEAANREANLYLDILTHDIKNADNVTNIYADLLIEELDGEPARHARKLKKGIKKSIEITANVATIRKIHENQTVLAPVSLDAVILSEIKHFPDLRIHYNGLPVEVLADNLLPEVFTNLIGNAAKHGKPGVEIMVTVEEMDEETVLVTIADTGPGIPDDMKEALFYRFEREGEKRGSQGLGLSICRMLTARYGGRVWVDDRVEGTTEAGAAFRFTLRKARCERST